MKLCTTSLLLLLSLLLTSCLSNGLHGPITNNSGGSSYGFFSLGKKKSKYGYSTKQKRTTGFFGNSYGRDNDSYYSAPKDKSFYGSNYTNSYYTKTKKKSSYYKKSKSRSGRRK